MRSRLSRGKVVAALFVINALSSIILLASTFAVFGPETFMPTLGSKKAQIFNRPFSVPTTATTYTLHLVNGGAGLSRVSSCGVAINGTLVVSPSEINQNVGSLNRTITVTSSNTMQLQIAGPSGSGITVTIDGVDNIPPTISATATPAPNGAGWNNTNVTVTFTCQDAISGIASCTGPVTVSSEGANQVVTGTATDRAGNTASTSVTISLDKTAPSVTPTISPSPNAAGWNKTDVIITYTCTDSLSGVQSCPASATIITDGAGQVVTATATDRAGNSATSTVTLNIDKTPPTVTPVASPGPNANGWNNTDVTVSYTCSDALSGVASCPPAAATSTEGAGQVVTGMATDRAGNAATASTSLSIDKTAPTISPQVSPVPNAAGWNNTDVTVSFTVSDALSGVANSTSPVVVTTEGAGHVVAGSVTDRAGNTASATDTVNLDKTRPTLNITAPTGTITGNPAPTIQLQYSDATSGLQTSTLQVSVDGVLLTGCSAGQTSATCVPPNLASGSHTITATVEDVAQNATGGTQTFELSLATPLEIAITQPLTGSLTRAATVQVTGTVSPQAESVFVNGIAASLQGGTFTADGVPLVEGNNTLTAVATNSSTGVGTITVTVVRDSTPPRVAIELPSAGRTVTTETVAVIGLVNDIVTGTVNAENCRVTVSGRAGSADAVVSNRSFMIDAFPLVPGPNTLTATATDTAGNVSVPFQVQVTREDPAGQKISSLNQATMTGVVGSVLSEPLVALLSSASGAPVAGRNVTFTVTRGDGTVASGESSGRSVTVMSDANGRAQVNFALGSRSGVGNQRVAATATGFVGEADFLASALHGPAFAIKTFRGETQRGAASRPLPEPFIVFVHDFAGNPVEEVPVTFEVTSGGGNIAGQTSVVVRSDVDGRANISLTLGADPGTSNNHVEARFQGMSGGPAVLTATSLPIGPPEQTRVSGVVLDNSNRPLPGATLRITGTNLFAVTDEQGRFVIAGAPVGTVHLVVDATTISVPGPWPSLIFELTTVSGQDNTIGMPIFLVALDAPRAALAGGDQDVTLTMSDVVGASLTVFAHSLTCPDRSSQCPVLISQVHNDKVPMPPLAGQAPTLVWTIQPMGATFNPPARVTFPNIDGLAPGRVVEIASFDHDLGQYVSVGTATVSEDGATITSDSGSGVIHSGWHFPWSTTPPTSCTSIPCVFKDPNPDDCKILTSGDSCTDGGCMETNAPDTTQCGLNTPKDGFCGHCFSGTCEYVHLPPANPIPCTAPPGTAEYYRCLIDNVYLKYLGVTASSSGNITSENDKKHSGQKGEIPGCEGDSTHKTDQTDATCRVVSKSWHYCDRAFDVRSKDKCPLLIKSMIADLRALPGVTSAGTEPALFDVNGNLVPRQGNDEHFHVEWGDANLECRQGQACTPTGPNANCNVCNWQPFTGTSPAGTCRVASFKGSSQALLCSRSCP
jgi:hypothetical protein